MRITHVLPGLAAGGMEQLVIRLTADAVARGDTVGVASGPGPWRAKVIEAGGAHLALPATRRGGPLGNLVAAARLAGHLRRARPDVVHSHNVRATMLARLALGVSGHRAVLMPTIHGLAPDDYPSASRVLRLCADRVIACAPAVARSLVAAGFPCGRVEVITNGAALAPAGPDREADLRRRLGLGEGPVVAGIGRLVPQKNWPVFIEAAAQVPGPSYVIAGDGPLREELAALCQRHGGRVRLAGLVDDIPALVGVASCVVSTSDWEGLPLTLLEALSLGAPVIATAVDGVVDVIPPSAALLVSPNDPAAVAAAVSLLLAGNGVASDLRDKALAAAPGWSPEQMLARYAGAYRAAAEGAPRWVSAAA